MFYCCCVSRKSNLLLAIRRMILFALLCSLAIVEKQQSVAIDSEAFMITVNEVDGFGYRAYTNAFNNLTESERGVGVLLNSSTKMYETISEICKSTLNKCNVNAKCVGSGKPSIYRCSCKPGFKDTSSKSYVSFYNLAYVPSGTNCTDVNECLLNASSCPHNANCSNTIGDYQCQCPLGYTSEAKNCRDIDECATGTSSCSKLANCSNTVGSYACYCPPGYNLINHTECIDLDECRQNTSSCPKNITCANTVGSYVCHCPAGYKHVENTCQDIDECTTETSRCSKLANCSNTDGSYACHCPPGYYLGDQTECYDINECIGNYTCHEQALCVNQVGKEYMCWCNSGWSGNGKTCIDLSAPSTLVKVRDGILNAAIVVLVLCYIATFFNLTAMLCPNRFTETVVVWFEKRLGDNQSTKDSTAA